MKKRNRYLIIISLIFILLLSFLLMRMEVSYQQGVNYVTKSVKIPLFLKIIDFFSRHFHYKDLIETIIVPSMSEEEKTVKLFYWTHDNIRNIPQDFPAIDDHVLNIIIRGYGASDQVSDVFTTLCNYAGIEAFFLFINSRAGEMKMPLSFVRINKKWRVFDPSSGVYFQDKEGNLADIETIKAGAYILGGKKEAVSQDYYANYIPNFPSFKDSVGLSRSKIQSPTNRLFYEIKKLIRQSRLFK